MRVSSATNGERRWALYQAAELIYRLLADPHLARLALGDPRQQDEYLRIQQLLRLMDDEYASAARR